MDFTFYPNKYMSYEKFVKCAIKDYRPITLTEGIMQFAVLSYPSCHLNQSIVFKIDGSKVHKKMKDCYHLISMDQLFAYDKTREEFWDDWHAYHNKKKKTS